MINFIREDFKICKEFISKIYCERKFEINKKICLVALRILALGLTIVAVIIFLAKPITLATFAIATTAGVVVGAVLCHDLFRIIVNSQKKSLLNNIADRNLGNHNIFSQSRLIEGTILHYLWQQLFK